MKSKITPEWFAMTLKFCGFSVTDKVTAIIMDAYKLTDKLGGKVSLKDMVELGLRNEQVPHLQFTSARIAIIKASVRRNHLYYRLKK